MADRADSWKNHPVQHNPPPVSYSYSFSFSLLFLHAAALQTILTTLSSSLPKFLWRYSTLFYPQFYFINFHLSLLKLSKCKSYMKGIWSQQVQNKCELFMPRYFLKLVLFERKKKKFHSDRQCRTFSEDCLLQRLTAATVEVKNELHPFQRCAILLWFCCNPLTEITPEQAANLYFKKITTLMLENLFSDGQFR